MRNAAKPALSFIGLLVLSVACLNFSGCRESSTQAGIPREQVRPQGDAPPRDHGEDLEKKSDLDRPLAELFSEICEHRTLMYQCDECRYEGGVVKVQKHVIESGLVKTAQVTRRAGKADLKLSGEISFDERKVARLSPSVPGIVTRVLVDLGQTVGAGQPLLSLRSAELAQAEGEYLESVSKLGLAEKTYNRQKGLREAKVNAEREFIEADEGLTAARIRTDAARQRLVRLGLSEPGIRALAEQGMESASGELNLRAPFGGTVLELDAVAGELINPGDQAVFVGDLSSLWIWANLYDRDLPGVLSLREKGEVRAAVTVQAFPGEEFPGQVDFIGSVMDEKTRTVRARVSLNNPDRRLRPGMFVTVSLDLRGDRDVLGVPSIAVLSDEGREFVFIHHEGDFFVRRPVVKGAEWDGFTEIRLGVDAGQTVAAEGSFLLKSDVLRSKMGAGCAD